MYGRVKLEPYYFDGKVVCPTGSKGTKFLTHPDQTGATRVETKKSGEKRGGFSLTMAENKS